VNDAEDDEARALLSPALAPAEESLRAPERAHRRAKSGLSLVAGTRVLALLAPAVAVFVVAAGVFASGVAPEAARDALPVVTDDVAERHSIDALVASMAALEERGRRLDEVSRAHHAQVLRARLVNELPRVAAEIARARDARKAKDATRSLSAPFDADELAHATNELALVPGVDWTALERVPKTGVAPDDEMSNAPRTVVRAIVTREGTFILPRDSTSGIDADLSTTGTGEDVGAYTRVLEDGSAVVAARVCVPREKHCLYEAVFFAPDVALANTKAALSALQAARSDLAQRRATAASDQRSASASTTALDVGHVVVARDRALWFFIGALALGLVIAFVSTRRAARVGARLAERTATLRAAVLGHVTSHPTTAVPAEIHALDDAIEEVRIALAEKVALQKDARARGAALTTFATVLLALTRGERKTPQGLVLDDEPVRQAVFALAALEESLRARAQVIARALESLPKSRVSGPDDDRRVEIEERVAALRPFATLLTDIALRTRALADKVDQASGNELMRLSEAVERRAKTAEGLIDGLARAVAERGVSLSHPAAGAAGDPLALVERELAALGHSDPHRERAHAHA